MRGMRKCAITASWMSRTVRFVLATRNQLAAELAVELAVADLEAADMAGDAFSPCT
jgi:hypothetical protein